MRWQSLLRRRIPHGLMESAAAIIDELFLTPSTSDLLLMNTVVYSFRQLLNWSKILSGTCRWLIKDTMLLETSALLKCHFHALSYHTCINIFAEDTVSYCTCTYVPSAASQFGRIERLFILNEAKQKSEVTATSNILA